MTEELPKESQPDDYEKMVSDEVERLREKRDKMLESPPPSGRIELPPQTEEGLRKMAERNVQLKIEKEKKRLELEREKKYILAEGPTEQELKEIAEKRLERRKNQ